MTKEQFFSLSADQRRSLIKRAHTYYASDFQEDLSKVKENDVKEFIALCIEERNAQALLDATLEVSC